MAVQPSEQPRILIADGGHILRMARHEFNTEGFEVAETVDCDTLIDLAVSWPAHLIILDEAFEGRGWDCLASVLDEAALKETPILFLVDAEHMQDEALQRGADRTLVKPFGPVTLIAVVREMIGRPLQSEHPD